MIHVGLAGWGDHDELYPARTRVVDKLALYAQHFPIVECDSSFYAIPKPDTVSRWVAETPAHFQFIVKAYQGMTGHQRGTSYYKSAAEQFQSLQEAIAPMIAADKLGAVLFQYPPWFDCQRKHVDVLRRTKEWMQDIPCALEFRHQSWYRPQVIDKTITFIQEEKWIHSVCDEPQAGEGSIPIVPVVTDSSKTVVRFHGRNAGGWVNRGQANWRDVRYLYRYNEDELHEWRARLMKLALDCKQLYVIFNNNSGGDAAGNAKQLMHMLGQTVPSFPPRQMDLFGD
ncbi:DUF72 domain-containing protein [Paenibacillus marinisediminis]